MSKLTINRMISFTELIEYLSSSSPNNIASPLGSMLDKLRDGIYFVNRPTENNEELKLLSKAPVLDCIDTLKNVHKIEFESVPDLKLFAKKAQVGEGALALAVVGSYYQWASKSEQRGLVEVYRLLQKMDSSLPSPEDSDESLAQSFRSGKGGSVKARDKSAKILADSELTLYSWVAIFNARQRRGGNHAANRKR